LGKLQTRHAEFNTTPMPEQRRWEALALPEALLPKPLAHQLP